MPDSDSVFDEQASVQQAAPEPAPVAPVNDLIGTAPTLKAPPAAAPPAAAPPVVDKSKKQALLSKIDDLFPEVRDHHAHHEPLADRVRTFALAVAELL